MNSEEIHLFLKKYYGEPDHTFKLRTSENNLVVSMLVYLPIPSEGIHSALLITSGFSLSRTKANINNYECIFEISGELELNDYKKISTEIFEHINMSDAFELHTLYKPLNLGYNTKLYGSIILNYGKHDTYFWDTTPTLQGFEVIPIYKNELEALCRQPRAVRNAVIYRSSNIEWTNWKRSESNITKEAINGVWNFIANWYEKNANRIFLQLNIGAEKEAIKDLELVLNKKLPKDFAYSLKRYNGEIEFHDYKYLSTSEIAETWSMMKEILESNSFPTKNSRLNGNSESKKDWWHKDWIPFAKDLGGNLMCLDLSSNEHGVEGHVIYWEKSEGPILTQYKSFFHWLFTYEQGLYNGYYNVDEEGHIYH